MIDTNCHTHTCRCKHAQGDVADYCREALAKGLKTLGFSDHTPLPDGRWHGVRMAMDDVAGYCRAIDEARATFTDLTILKGLECEYIPEFAGVYRDEFLGTWAMDYLVGGAHWYPHKGAWAPLYTTGMTPAQLHDYADYVIAAMQSGLFAFIAHPDLFGVAYAVWDAEATACSRAMLTAATELGVPMEINGYGLRKPMMDTPEGRRHKYPWLRFWELAAECGTPVVLSSDAHEPENVVTGLVETEAIAQRFGLRVVTDPVRPKGAGQATRTAAAAAGRP